MSAFLGHTSPAPKPCTMSAYLGQLPDTRVPCSALQGSSVRGGQQGGAV